MNNDGSCFNWLATGDQNTAGFGPLPASLLAYTCVWWLGAHETTESDMRINPDQNAGKFFATDSKPGTCNNLYDLEGVATHERGHTFGIDDLNTNNHPNLTMRDIMVICSLEQRFLGKGDIKGLNTLY
jgi:hypothetical protein